jgi:DNA polymerase III subunit epsilon
VQRSFDDLGTPLRDVTFCVIDLETTGGSAKDCAITEIGAVKFRGGECLGTFQTLVDPGCAIPPTITVLTGITDAMVCRAPRIDAVLPALMEFIGGAVVVGHNVRFDVSFLQAALERHGWPPLASQRVDTVGLARRLLADEVPNCRLGTLADRLRLDHRPTHRALDDALTTGDLLHLLIERASALGVTGLDDLMALPTMAGHRQAPKLRLTEDLPRSPGVYVFRGHAGEVLYIGKATNLRSRVRSYFSTDTRRKVGGLLRETARVDHLVCAGTLEATVRELRLIHRHQPRYNARHTRPTQAAYVKLTTTERYPRLSAVRTVRDDGALYLGPLTSTAGARRIIEAIETVVPLRRCTDRPGRSRRDAPCTAAQLGVATCPCAGGVDEPTYARLVEHVRRGLTTRPELLLDPLAERLRRLAAEGRFEEAADVRDRAAALAGALRRQRRIESLRAAGTLVVSLPGGEVATLAAGLLVSSTAGSTGVQATLTLEQPETPTGGVLDRAVAEEILCIAAELDRLAPRVVLLHADAPLVEPVGALPTFQPVTRSILPQVRAGRAA